MSAMVSLEKDSVSPMMSSSIGAEARSLDELNNEASSSDDDVMATRTRRRILSCAAASNALVVFATISFLLVSVALVSRASQQFDPEEIPSGRNEFQRSSLFGSTSHEQQQQRRRVLSVFKKKCNSPPKLKQKAQIPIPPTYFATYPGSGSKITRQLIKTLTGGLRIQNEHDQIQRHDVVATQTKYPHKSGALVDWDEDIHRTIILIRNPMNALPNLFDELYSSKKHLPVKFHPEQPVRDVDATASVGDWVSWRDRMFDSQMAAYVEFMHYWIRRYGHKERVFISFEDLVDEKTGSEEALRLTEFLGRVEEVPTVELEDVPCVWQMVFRNGGAAFEDDEADDGDEVDDVSNARHEDVARRLRVNDEVESTEFLKRQKIMDPSERRRRRQLSGYFIPHPSSIHAEPNTRPYTIEQLKFMVDTLQNIAKEIYTHSHYLKKLILRYRDEIIEAVEKFDDTIEEEVGMNMQRPQTQSFHIFQVSPPGTESPVVHNWLIGLFEPDAQYTKLDTSPTLRVYQHEKEVSITTTIVTQTNEMRIIELYKIFKPGFDEVFFFVSKSGTDADQQIDGDLCNFENILCIEYEEQVYNDEEELEATAHHLTEKAQRRFSHIFAPLGNAIGMGEQGAITRLKKMNYVIQAMESRPFEVIDPTFGIHGGIGKPTADDLKGPPKRLFYCGSTGSGTYVHFTVLGIYLANAFFPEIVGTIPMHDNSGNEAIPLTQESINDATPNDFLVHHMHQHCDVDVLTFPGMQLHINHPTHGFSSYGMYTPPGKNIFVIGAHDDGVHSIQLPYAMMVWWVMAKGLGSNGNIDGPTMEKLFVPSARPKNTGKHFLLYVNSHYVAHREMAAYTLSQLGPVHALGSCQGNINVVPVFADASRPSRCQPYTDDMRPPSIIVPEELDRKGIYFNKAAFQDFRFMLLMEDANIPGYITERIVDGFMAGTIPIWYGTTQIFDIFNPKAFIYYDINNPQEALDRIRHLEDNPDAYQQMLNEPILADGERTIEKYFSFEDSIGNGVLKDRVRRKLGFPIIHP